MHSPGLRACLPHQGGQEVREDPEHRRETKIGKQKQTLSQKWRGNHQIHQGIEMYTGQVITGKGLSRWTHLETRGSGLSLLSSLASRALNRAFIKHHHNQLLLLTKLQLDVKDGGNIKLNLWRMLLWYQVITYRCCLTSFLKHTLKQAESGWLSDAISQWPHFCAKDFFFSFSPDRAFV